MSLQEQPSKAAGNELALQLLTQPALRQRMNRDSKMSLSTIYQNAVSAMQRLGSQQVAKKAVHDNGLLTHRALVEGLPGEAMFISSAFLFDSVEDASSLFGLTAKTMRAKRGARLDLQQGEASVRLMRACEAAARVHGSFEAGREWMKTPNFALGGEQPVQLLKTADGTAMVLRELQAQDDSAPL